MNIATILIWGTVCSFEISNFVAYDGNIHLLTSKQIQKQSKLSNAVIQRDLLYPVHINDPYYEEQFYLKAIGFEETYPNFASGDTVTIAVIDTGIDLDHPDLKGHIWINEDEIPDNGIDDDGNGYIDDIHGWDFVELHGELSDYYLDYEDYTAPDNDPNDVSGHGTAVSGIIGAIINNNIGVTGLCPNVRIMPIRAGFMIEKDSEKLAYVLTSTISKAIEYAADNGAQIINMSFGTKEQDTILKIIIFENISKCLYVASAGNSGESEYYFPSSYSTVISVAALTADGINKATYSTFNSEVDFCAPGEAIVCFNRPGDSSKYKTGAGTSFSSPIIAGTLGILISQGHSRSSALGEMNSKFELFNSFMGRKVDFRKLFDVVPESTNIGVQGLVILKSDGSLNAIGDIDVNYLLAKGTLENFSGNNAQDICLTPDGRAGYVIDKRGGLYRLGDAPNLGTFPNFENEDIRGITLVYEGRD